MLAKTKQKQQQQQQNKSCVHKDDIIKSCTAKYYTFNMFNVCHNMTCSNCVVSTKG